MQLLTLKILPGFTWLLQKASYKFFKSFSSFSIFKPNIIKAYWRLLVILIKLMYYVRIYWVVHQGNLYYHAFSLTYLRLNGVYHFLSRSWIIICWKKKIMDFLYINKCFWVNLKFFPLLPFSYQSLWQVVVFYVVNENRSAMCPIKKS